MSARMGLNLIVERDAGAVSRRAADLVTAAIRAEPDLAGVFATGNSPMALYAELAARQSAGAFDARRMRVFQLDSYIGIADDDPRSLYGWMDRSLLVPLGIPQTQVHRFAERTPDPDAACRALAREIEDAGGFALSILGLGPNGHLGFNEPPSGRNAPTRVVALTPESVASNAVYWGGAERVPLTAMTVGLDALLSARQTILVVVGAHKHRILRQTVEGPVTPDVPASFLQEAANVTVLADEAAWTGRG